ncbi:MAG: site-specific integrase [Armatimonadota bacterium]
MVTELTPAGTAPVSLPTTELVAQTKAYIYQAKATNTREAYRRDWADFTRWCAAYDCTALPATPETVAVYLTDLITNGRKVSTLQRRLVSISQAHKHADMPSPTSATIVREALKGIMREHGTRPTTVDALLTEDIRRICQALPETLIGLRTSALLLLGFAGGFRRSELVAMSIEDVEECADGLRIVLRQSKTDQTGEGRVVGIPFGSHPSTCPVRAYKAWLEHSGITSGAIFRGMDKGGRIISDRLTGRAVAQIIQRATVKAGLDHKHVAGHSLRSGHATSAACAGVAERIIMKQTDHRSERMVRGYIREAGLFTENSACSLGL